MHSSRFARWTARLMFRFQYRLGPDSTDPSANLGLFPITSFLERGCREDGV